MQGNMDVLEADHILCKPEDLGITVQNVFPRFLVKKLDRGGRLVTAFNSLSAFARPPPFRATSSEEIMFFFARWPCVIKSDMTSQFFQLPLARDSMKYAATMTPFKGSRVYARAAMSIPGSTEHLDELMFRVLVDLIHESVVAKIADDLYISGEHPDHLLYNWQRTLECCQQPPTQGIQDGCCA